MEETSPREAMYLQAARNVAARKGPASAERNIASLADVAEILAEVERLNREGWTPEAFEAGEKLSDESAPAALCGRREGGCPNPAGSGPCPYRSDVGNEPDAECECDCCDACRQICADDI